MIGEADIHRDSDSTLGQNGIMIAVYSRCRFFFSPLSQQLWQTKPPFICLLTRVWIDHRGGNPRRVVVRLLFNAHERQPLSDSVPCGVCSLLRWALCRVLDVTDDLPCGSLLESPSYTGPQVTFGIHHVNSITRSSCENWFHFRLNAIATFCHDIGLHKYLT